MPNIEGNQYSFELPGVAEEKQPFVQENVEKLVNIVAAVAKAKGKPFLLKLVRLTSTFQDDVNELEGQITGYGDYTATRELVHAIGKTLCIHSQEEGIGFAILIDTTELGTLDNTNGWFLTTIVHELIHVIFEGEHLQWRGHNEYLAPSETAEQLLRGWAKSILDEFDVDQYVDVIVEMVAKNDKGEPFSLLELEEAKGMDWANGTLSALQKMPSLVDKNVEKYKTGQMNLHEFLAIVMPCIKDLLILITHTASIYRESASWQGIVEQIQATEAYERFLNEHLESILGQLNPEQIQYKSALAVVMGHVEKILENCGLTLKTCPQGLYVGVTWPATNCD